MNTASWNNGWTYRDRIGPTQAGLDLISFYAGRYPHSSAQCWAERLAAGGFALSLVELAQLVELPLRSREARPQAWPWRDWTVVPLGQGRWRLERDAGGLASRQ